MKLRTDRVWNDRIREGTWVHVGLGERVEQANLRWYGHVMRMDKSRYPRTVHKPVVPEGRPKGRPRKTWMNGVDKAFRDRG